MIAKKRLCLVIPSLNTGGMERVMSELTGFFCQKELEVHLILYGKSLEIFYTVPENLIINKPRTVFNNKFRFIYTIGRLIYLRQTIKKISPHSVLSFGEYWNSFVLIALLGLSYPVFISDRCSPVKQFGIFHSFLRIWLYPKARGIIAQTEKAREIYLKRFHHPNIKVIGNPIREIKQSSEIVKENIVLTVGRLIHSKNHNKLIEIFTQISAPDWKMVIIGDDGLKQKNLVRLKETIDNLNYAERITLVGTLKNIDNYYLCSKIFAFTSSSEGFPNVIGEALSSGLPVIAYDCITGPSELIIDGENGFLVPLFDKKYFREKLQFLIDNEDIRSSMSKKAVESVKFFSIEIIGQKYLDFIIQNSMGKNLKVDHKRFY